jgi:hypothetical protein
MVSVFSCLTVNELLEISQFNQAESDFLHQSPPHFEQQFLAQSRKTTSLLRGMKFWTYIIVNSKLGSVTEPNKSI